MDVWIVSVTWKRTMDVLSFAQIKGAPPKYNKRTHTFTTLRPAVASNETEALNLARQAFDDSTPKGENVEVVDAHAERLCDVLARDHLLMED